ncbi:acetoacetate decarboxylase family protein [Steroidobacter cummioxidans]|uniref:acetoacetate decarboxylase family protein n=1 Tax=Steroidobacter cummioxidans TaxID=1803913 RepID=UPI000E313D04|nr:acetoacetate decarboxylase family protein [Steroidobacter cummioxidans]
MALDDPHFQAAPWTLHGDAIVAVKRVDRDVAKRLVPPDADVVAVWPGRTLAILYLANYRKSPVGEYRELIVAPALVSRKGRVGFWISHIYVDSAASLAAGRTIWALPKQMTAIDWGADRLSSSSPQLQLQSVVAPSRGSLPLPFIGAAMSKYGLAQSWFAVRGNARVGFARASMELSEQIGLSELGFSGTMGVWVCSQMKVTIGRPRK